MGSRIKEDEKHEKIIRGLAKREENRRCINCGALGPQYVCTNFSIFVCTNCSGVHREFTHRVKSISMAKFTAAEVDALQAGGNQRGREIFFKNWDSHRHTLPDSSYPDKVREFIKAVYVDRRYIGDKPPQRGKQGDREDIPNYRKSDYRSDSYPESQSPSYEYRFENNRYGNRPLSRGSDGGRYEDRGLHYDDTRSPGRYGPGRGRHDRSDRDRRFEDRFANDGLKSPGRFEYDRSRLDRSPYSDGDRRFEDRFANEARDPRRTNERPPTYPDYGSESSPPVRSVREILGDDIPALRIEDNIHTNGRIEDAKGLRSQAQPRKDLHTSSFGSSDNGASTAGSDLSLKRDNSGSLIDFGADSDIPAETVRSDPFGVTSLQPPAQSSSTGWALFDVNPGSEQKVETVPGLGAPLEAADPFRASKSGVEGLTTLATPMLDSWPSSLQWTSVNPAMANRPSDQNLVVPGQAGVQLAQKGPAPVVAAAAAVPAQNQESKPQNNQRSEIPEDLFTPSFLNMGMQLGHQFPLGGPSFMPLGSALPGVYVQGGFQGYGQRPKSKNPFDLPEETAQVPASAFPNMAVLQTALPNAPLPPFSNPGIRSAAPQWSQTAPVNQQPASFPSAGLPVGSGFFNQQPSTFMPPLLQQYSFTPAPSPDQFTGYQHGPQMFVPASGFGVPQSSTRPIGGNPFD